MALVRLTLEASRDHMTFLLRGEPISVPCIGLQRFEVYKDIRTRDRKRQRPWTATPSILVDVTLEITESLFIAEIAPDFVFPAT